ncbi:GNAT family N-acetyltransferase [Sphingomonas crusticola]|uniref:GNAT family N-acetyltransferase n=1 Tax=Sphingomonas crusticola TaxID=1697973 RepID=UPI0013C35898|nr:GNAT family N-acetyltransferase [Sphingomonas crusticola]
MLGRAEHDFYHLPCYLELSAAPGETPLAYLATAGEHRLLIPFLRRPLPAAICGDELLFDAASPYGYPGPIRTRGAPTEFVMEALAPFGPKLREGGLIAGFVRLHTLLNDPALFAGIGEIVNHGPSVFIDLTLSPEELWAQTRRGHKRDLAVLERRGYEITMDDWSRFDDFLTCYYDSMKRLGAGDFYFFSRDYFDRLRACLGDRIHLCLLHLDGEIACAGLVTEMDGLCQYHLSATADPHFQDHPSKLMLHHLRFWLKARGNRIYHVGGGVGALRDTLHLFKAGFSPLSADFHTWRVIPDRALYDRLVERWSAATGREPVESEHFFPQYRAPLEI